MVWDGGMAMVAQPPKLLDMSARADEVVCPGTLVGGEVVRVGRGQERGNTMNGSRGHVKGWAAYSQRDSCSHRQLRHEAHHRTGWAIVCRGKYQQTCHPLALSLYGWLYAIPS